MRPHAGRHDDRKAGISRGASDRQSMRAEVPILGDEEEKLRPAAPRRCGVSGDVAQRSL